MSVGRKRRNVRYLQKYLLNPPTKLAVFLGAVPGHALIETTGRRTGRTRRTVVGVQKQGATLWIVAEQGRYAGYVRNIEAHPGVRVRLRGRWREGVATLVDTDDPVARLNTFGRPVHAQLVRKLGTALLSIRVDLEPSP